MLVLSRKQKESVNVFVGDSKIRVRVLSIKGNSIRLGFDGPENAKFVRAELEMKEAPPEEIKFLPLAHHLNASKGIES